MMIMIYWCILRMTISDDTVTVQKLQCTSERFFGSGYGEIGCLLFHPNVGTGKSDDCYFGKNNNQSKHYQPISTLY